MAVPVGVCAPWVDPVDVPCLADGPFDADQARAIAVFASDVMFVLSNGQWPGVCSRVVRPDLGSGRVWWCEEPGRWRTMGALWPREDGTVMRLPGPVESITAITVDGVALASTAYVLQGRNRVFRVDGENWPLGQDLSRSATVVPGSPLPAGSLPAWQVAYEFGAEPPESGRQPFISLACEIAAATQGKPCRLPWAGAAATVTRRGVAVSYGDMADKMPLGRVGLADVDLWLNTARGGPWRPRKARVISATQPARKVVSTWPTP